MPKELNLQPRRRLTRGRTGDIAKRTSDKTRRHAPDRAKGAEENPHAIFPEIRRRYPESIRLICGTFPDVIEWHGGPDAGGGTQVSWNLQRDALHLLLGACEAARAFNWKAGPARFTQDAAALREARSAAKAARKLAIYLRQYRAQADEPLVIALMQAGVTLRRSAMPPSDIEDGPLHHTRGATAEVLSSALGLVAGSLEKKQLIAKRGALLYRHVYGPLLFAEPLDSARRRGHLPNRTQAHFAYLIFLLFKLTDGSRGYWQTGEPMPSREIPAAHRKIAAALVRETFDAPNFDRDSDALESLAKLLQRNPQLRVIGYSY